MNLNEIHYKINRSSQLYGVAENSVIRAQHFCLLRRPNPSTGLRNAAAKKQGNQVF